MRRIAFLLWPWLTGSAGAQLIEVTPPTYVECRAPVPDGATARYDWSADKGVIFSSDGNRATVSKILPGKHLLHCCQSLAKLVDGKIELLPAGCWAQPLDGGPEPPQPPPVDLAALAGKDAPALSAAYGSFIDPLNAGRLPTTDTFRNALAIRLGALSANAAAPEVSKRIDAAIGTDNAPLAADNTGALVACLRDVVKQLGAPPIPPPAPPIDPSTPPSVLITFDPSMAGLTQQQKSLVYSTSFRAYLDGHKIPWRITNNAAIFNSDQPAWQKLMAIPRGANNWLIVTNGTSTDSVPLPADEPAALAIVGRYVK